MSFSNFEPILQGALQAYTQNTAYTKDDPYQIGDGNEPATVKVPQAARRYKGEVYLFSPGKGVQVAIWDIASYPFPEKVIGMHVIAGYQPRFPDILVAHTVVPGLTLTGTGGASGLQAALVQAANPPQLASFRMAATSTPGLSIAMSGGWFQVGNIMKSIAANTSWLDLTSNIPSGSGNARYVSIAIDSDGASDVVKGAVFEVATVNEKFDYVPTVLTVSTMLLGWVYLPNGASTITIQSAASFDNTEGHIMNQTVLLQAPSETISLENMKTFAVTTSGGFVRDSNGDFVIGS